MRRSLAALVLMAALSGCATVGDQEDAAAGVATRLLSAVEAGEGDAACATLAPETAKTVAEDEPCPDAILDKSLPRPGTVVGTSVYGQWAQVKFTDDTVFLAAFPEGWRVVAAGCTPQASRPYDCTVEGG
ncbi:lipoprotein [Actinoplanes sp. NPDC000266]